MNWMPRWREWVMAVFLVVGLGSPVLAQEDKKEEETSIVPIIPEVQLKGSTEGKSELKATLGLQKATSASWDIQARLNYGIETNEGLAKVFDPDANLGASAPWKVGLTFSFLKVSDPYKKEQQLNTAIRKAKAWCICASRCSSPEETDKKFCTIRQTALQEQEAPLSEDFCSLEDDEQPRELPKQPHPYYIINPPDFCQAGLTYFKSTTPNEFQAKNPSALYNVGFNVGRDEFEFLRSDGGTPAVLTPGSRVGTTWKMGASAAWLQDLGKSWLSYEALVAVGSEFEASTKKVRFCAPRGNVVEDGVSSPAEECKDTVIGEPTRVPALEGAFYVGNLDQKLNTYRVAGGLQVFVPLDPGAKDTVRLTFSVPIYINLTSKEGDYKGLVRVGPSVTYADRRVGESETTFSISLALLGQRLLFTQEFDEL